MEFFIKKIFDGTSDELVHLQFIKFSRGDFVNKAMFKAKFSKGACTINTTADYSNELVRAIAEELGTESAEVTGLIVSTRDLTGEVDFIDKSQFQGVKKYKIKKTMTGDEIISLCEKLPFSFMGLSFKTTSSELKIKEKMPKSGKPSKKDEENPKADFCKLKTTNKDIIKSMIFDKEAEGAKDIFCQHKFIIESIKIPDEAELTEKGVDKNDFAKIRELSKRVGKIVRDLDIDGKKVSKETPFAA